MTTRSLFVVLLCTGWFGSVATGEDCRMVVPLASDKMGAA